MAGQLSYDSFFGVYPSLTVGYSLDSLFDFSAYATYYPSSAFEGVETGVNLQVSSQQRKLTLTPGIGLVSGSVFVEGRPFALAEGYVVSLGIQFEQTNWYILGFGEYIGRLLKDVAQGLTQLIGPLQIRIPIKQQTSPLLLILGPVGGLFIEHIPTASQQLFQRVAIGK